MGNYKEISRAKIFDNKNVVISSFGNNSYTIAQEIIINENGKNLPIFLKGAIHVNDLQGLKNIKQALESAIKEIENIKNIVWDE